MRLGAPDPSKGRIGREKAPTYILYGGTVAAFDAKVRWYRVDYDDRDVEEVSISELRAILLQ